MEQEIETRWLKEFHAFSEELQIKHQNRLQHYDQIFLDIAKVLGYTVNDLKSDAGVIQRTATLTQMGAHFQFILDAVKENDIISAHWDQLLVLMKIYEDENTPKLR